MNDTRESSQLFRGQILLAITFILSASAWGMGENQPQRSEILEQIKKFGLPTCILLSSRPGRFKKQKIGPLGPLRKIF